MLVIDLAQAVDLANARGLDIADEVDDIESAMRSIGLKLAEACDVTYESATIEPEAFAGAAICRSWSDGNYPFDLRELDPEGD